MSEVLDRLLRGDVSAAAHGHSMFPQYLLFATLALAILFSVQGWMAIAYTGALDLHAFGARYYHGVYRYRIFGRDLMVEVYRLFTMHFADKPRLLVVSLLMASIILMGMRVHRAVRPALVVLLFSLPCGVAILIRGKFRALRPIVPSLLSVLCLYVFFSQPTAPSGTKAFRSLRYHARGNACDEA